MEVLVTGGDTELGRTVAEGFRDAGHRVVITGARRDELEVAAKELDVDAIVCRQHRPGQPRGGPRGCSRITSTPSSTCPRPAGTPATPAPTRWPSTRPRGATLSTPRCCRAVLTVQTWAITCARAARSSASSPTTPARAAPRPRSRRRCRTGPPARPRTSAPAESPSTSSPSGRSAEPGYDGLSRTPPPVAAEIARLALFLTTPAARHITGQTLHVSHGALAHFG